LGIVDFFPDEVDVTPDGIDYGHGVSQGDSQAWKSKR
jgi:hypothetical protein